MRITLSSLMPIYQRGNVILKNIANLNYKKSPAI